MAPRLSSSTRSTTLLAVNLRRHVRQSGKSLRTIESDLGWGHGTLGNLLHGRTEIRLHHVEGLAKALGLSPLDLLREVYDDVSLNVVAVTLAEERLATLIHEAVANALEAPPAERSRPAPAQPVDLNDWLTTQEPEGWRGARTAFRSGAKARLAGQPPTVTSYREGDRFIEHFRNGFEAMSRALDAGAVFACPSCSQPLPHHGDTTSGRGNAALSMATQR
jgi:transcriptional regulator with XRE-family HTH domain